MKKIQPISTYDSDDSYPSVTGKNPDRRGFFKSALVGSAALGGSLLLGDVAISRRKPQYHRVNFRLNGHYQYYPCRLRIGSMLVQTKSKRLAKFLGDPKEQARTEKRLSKILRAAGCTDVQNAKKLARLHTKLAGALSTQYRQRTRRKVTRPIVTLSLHPVRHFPVPGGIRRPHRPHP